MQKLPQETADVTQQNIDRIAELFPSAITETKDADGRLKHSVNFDILKQLLSDEVVDGEECYEFTWVGKKQSILEGNRPIRKTLRPVKDESKNWDTTENLYIEGDNLDVLKLLQNSYLNSIKMIYIDPPYNTGNDFVYRDNFAQSREEYDEEMGVYDEEEDRLFKNTDSNGRFHSDWCSMMYPRLQLARNLLSDGGVIFISIDDNEVRNLKNICDEVFGESNFVALLPTIMNLKGNNDQYAFAGTHEHTIVYTKKYEKSIFYELYLSAEELEDWSEDELGLYKKGANLKSTGINAPRHKRPNLFFPIYVDEENKICLEKKGNCTEILPMTDGKEMTWRWSKEKFSNEIHNVIVVEGNGSYSLYKKQRNNDNERPTKKPKSIFFRPEYASGNGSGLMKALFNNKVFDFPKPLELIKDFVTIGTRGNDVILDFFSGSATTAHAVMQLNAEDGGNRKFIMVQLPEETDQESEAYKAGYKNICEIGKERIRRAGKLIEEENKNVDTGFRVLKVDSTNMKDVYYSAGEYNQQMLLDLESNIKDDRTDLDLLYGVLLDWGVPLSLPQTTEIIEGKRVHFVNEDNLVACFEDDINENVVREIAKRKPERVVFRDSSFNSSPEKINVTEIFKTLSPDTSVKVI
ncbi:MAG: site-specific DNA-methyltransferase [Clostridiaceae bacterium]|nr:site-specific DNA-methyltransferase [Clostridiaceae bacterium]